MFAGKKTYITAALAVIGALAAYLTGDATAMQAGQLALTALIGAFVRHGIATTAAA